MFAFATDTLQPDTRRVLSLRSRLLRLRLVNLGVFEQILRRQHRRAQLATLVERLFPGEILEGGWLDMLWTLGHLCESKKWFVVDWLTLDWLYDGYMQVGDEDGQGYLDQMAWYIERIPVRYYNYTEEDWLNYVIEEYPVLPTIRALTDPTYGMRTVEKLIEYELYDAEIDLLGLPARCRNVPEPLCRLPLVVQYARSETGNPLLDQAVDLYEQDFQVWRWDDEVELGLAKQFSAEAQPQWANIEAFLEWSCKEPGAEEMVINLLYGVDV